MSGRFCASGISEVFVIKTQVYKSDDIVSVSMIVKFEMIATADMDWMGNKWWLSYSEEKTMML